MLIKANVNFMKKISNGKNASHNCIQSYDLFDLAGLSDDNLKQKVVISNSIPQTTNSSYEFVKKPVSKKKRVDMNVVKNRVIVSKSRPDLRKKGRNITFEEFEQMVKDKFGDQCDLS